MQVNYIAKHSGQKAGLLVWFVRECTEPTEPGIVKYSRHCRQAVLIADGLPELTEPDNETPALYLCSIKIDNKPEHLYAQPGDCNHQEFNGYSFSGNFIHSCDGRFHDINDYPIPVHDRKE